MKKVAREILNTLSGWDAPAAEAVIYAQVNDTLGGRVLFTDFDDAIKLCQTERWIAGIEDPLLGTLWSITNKGRAQRHA
jgi:hypothetical protein